MLVGRDGCFRFSEVLVKRRARGLGTWCERFQCAAGAGTALRARGLSCVSGPSVAILCRVLGTSSAVPHRGQPGQGGVSTRQARASAPFPQGSSIPNSRVLRDPPSWQETSRGYLLSCWTLGWEKDVSCAPWGSPTTHVFCFPSHETAPQHVLGGGFQVPTHHRLGWRRPGQPTCSEALVPAGWLAPLG